MKNFRIRTLNPEVSELIQQLMFKVGGEWGPHGFQINYTEKPFLFFNEMNNRGIIGHADDENYYMSHDFREITFEQLLNEVEQELEQND